MKHSASDKVIQGVLARLDRLEKEVFGPGQRSSPEEKRKGSTQKGLPVHILKLRDQEFFKQAKTAKEVHTKLQSHYHCDLNRVEVGLLRLQKRKQLRKASKGTGDKKKVAYVW